MIAAAGVILASLALAVDAPRVALLVGNDVGMPDERRLRFTGADADRLATVLEEVGGFAREDVHVLKDRTAADILDAIDLLAKGPAASTFVFFYSGHADAGALHPAGTLLPLDLLLHRLRSVRAELRIEILDACQSGAAARPKGSRPAAPFQVHIDGQAPSGDILISSSADDEQSFEGERGGIFTLHLTAGLRGAADSNGDGQVTLGEVYEYAYAQTLRSTLAASSGPQHARFRYDLTGRRDPVLTWLTGGGLLTFQPQTDGEYVVFDGVERSVVAELPARAGESRRLALAPGDYVVKQRGVRSLRVARLQLATGDDRVLLDHQMREVPLLHLARKGSPGERHVTVSAGQYTSGLGPRGLVLGALGLEWEGARWLVGIDAAASVGDEVNRGLRTRDTLLQGSASVLYSLRVGTAAVRLGPVAGVSLLRQATNGRPARQAGGASAGARLRVDLQATPSVGVFASAELRALAARMTETPGDPGVKLGGVGVVPWGAYGIGLRATF